MNIPLMRSLPKECPWCHEMPVLAKILYGMIVMGIMENMNIMLLVKMKAAK